jgi:hypothetical protein
LPFCLWHPGRPSSNCVAHFDLGGTGTERFLHQEFAQVVTTSIVVGQPWAAIAISEECANIAETQPVHHFPPPVVFLLSHNDVPTLENEWFK